MLVEPLQCQQITCPSNPASSMGTKQVARSVVGQMVGVGHNHYFSQKECDSLTFAEVQ